MGGRCLRESRRPKSLLAARLGSALLSPSSSASSPLPTASLYVERSLLSASCRRRTRRSLTCGIVRFFTRSSSNKNFTIMAARGCFNCGGCKCMLFLSHLPRMFNGASHRWTPGSQLPQSRHAHLVGVFSIDFVPSLIIFITFSYNCGLEGHVSKDCTAETKAKTCYKCGQEGHIVSFLLHCIFNLYSLPSPSPPYSPESAPRTPPPAVAATPLSAAHPTAVQNVTAVERLGI
ncbi:hypothetical protein C8Q80DRAFT_737077 [Daedaleopsis nitida]|nr:hypothetical protein C8Q80DRAFT_737077 [Daedaleopsis nitida]